METKTVNIPLPQIKGVELKNATVDLEKGVVVAEYGEEDIWKDISEVAVDFRGAVYYLYEDLHDSKFRTTKKHMTKLEALNQLIILAEAWNTFDGFKPDWENREQYKWHPSFEFRKGKFEFWSVSYVQLISDTHTSIFSFKTEERAEQFGRQFIDLFRIALTN